MSSTSKLRTTYSTQGGSSSTVTNVLARFLRTRDASWLATMNDFVIPAPIHPYSSVVQSVEASLPTQSRQKWPDLWADPAPAKPQREAFLPPDAVEEGERAVLGRSPRPEEHGHLDLALGPDLPLQGADLEDLVGEEHPVVAQRPPQVTVLALERGLRRLETRGQRRCPPSAHCPCPNPASTSSSSPSRADHCASCDGRPFLLRERFGATFRVGRGGGLR